MCWKQYRTQPSLKLRAEVQKSEGSDSGMFRKTPRGDRREFLKLYSELNLIRDSRCSDSVMDDDEMDFDLDSELESRK